MARCLTPKIALCALTAVFWLAAAGLIFVGVFVFTQYKHYEQIGDAVYTLIPASIIMALGVFFFILGLIGCIGAFKEQRCMLGVYFTILLVILVGMVVTTALGYEYIRDVESSVQDGLDDALNHYGNDSTFTSEVDFVQSHLKCCGVHNASDWLDTPWHSYHKESLYPTSCCVNDTCNYHPVNGTDPNLYNDGCYEKLYDLSKKYLTIIIGTAAGFAVLLILGMVCACALLCRHGDGNPYMGMTGSDHMTV